MLAVSCEACGDGVDASGESSGRGLTAGTAGLGNLEGGGSNGPMGEGGIRSLSDGTGGAVPSTGGASPSTGGGRLGLE